MWGRNLSSGNRAAAARRAAVLVLLTASLSVLPAAGGASIDNDARWAYSSTLNYNSIDVSNTVQMVSDGEGLVAVSWGWFAQSVGTPNVSVSGTHYGYWYATGGHLPGVVATYLTDLALAPNSFRPYLIAHESFNGSVTHIYVTRIQDLLYDTGLTVRVDETTQPVDSPRIVSDAQGNATVMWPQRVAGSYNYSLWANHSTGGVWEGATPIENLPGGVRNYKLAIDGDGNVVALWEQFDSPKMGLYTNRFVPGIGWGSPYLITDSGAGYEDFGGLSVSPSGLVTAFWREVNGTNRSLNYSWYAPGGSWSSGTPLPVGNTSMGLIGPIVATGAAGDLWVTWLSSYNDYRLRAASVDPAAGWGPVDDVAVSQDYITEPQLAVSGDGQAFLAYQAVVNGRRSEGVAHYSPQWGWRDAGTLSTSWNPSSGPRDVRLAVGKDGTFLLLAVMNSGTPYSDKVTIYTFTPDVDAPSLSLSSPAPGAVSSEATVRVAGQTDPGSTVTVDGALIGVAADGSFSQLVALSPGGNDVTVTATDAVGNAVTETRSVTFNDPVPGLTADLAAAQARADALEAQLGDAQANLTAALSQLADAQEALAGVQADANATAADLAAAQAAVQAAQSDATDAQARVAALETAQTQAAADLAAAQAKADSADASAWAASTLGLLGAALGAVGIGVGAFAARQAAAAKKVTVRGWDPEKKEEIVGESKK